MANTFIPLASTELSSAQSYIEFTGISATYSDLYCVVSARSSSTTTSESIIFRINGTDGSSIRFGLTIGSSGVSSNQYVNDGSTPGASTNPSTIFGNADCYIAQYADTNKYKVWSSNAVNAINSSTFPNESIKLTAGNNYSTTALTSLRISPGTNNWVQYSRADLYGIKNT